MGRVMYIAEERVGKAVYEIFASVGHFIPTGLYALW